MKASEDCQLFQPEKYAKNTVTCCKGHDFSVRPCSSPLHSSVYNRTHELHYVLLCPLIISHARSSLHRLRNGSKSQRGAQLLRCTKQEKEAKKKGKLENLPFLLVSNLRDNPWGQGWLLRKIEACDLS